MDGKTEEEYLSEVMKQKRMADAAGVTIWQVHGPWRYPPHDETTELRAERAELMRRSIRATAHIGYKYWVIHPLFPFGDCGFDMDSFWRINEEFFKELVPYAKEYGVTDKEIVKVRLDTGRPLIFDDVVVRVSEKFALAMHIDTDECNAAAAAGAVYGEIVK